MGRVRFTLKAWCLRGHCRVRHREVGPKVFAVTAGPAVWSARRGANDKIHAFRVAVALGRAEIRSWTRS